MSRPSGARGRAAAAQTKKTVRKKPDPAGTSRTASSGGGQRLEGLLELCEYCSAAQRIAEAHGEKLLAYLLSMAGQEGAMAARRHAVSVTLEPKQP